MQTNSTTYAIAHKTRNVNARYRTILSWIFECYDGWQFNDSNQTDDVLYADQTLTSGTSVYALPASAIMVAGAEVQNTGGTWAKLKPITQEQIQTTAGSVAEFHDVSGVPLWYMLRGDSIDVRPAPNYTQASSLRVYFLQDAVSFAVTDTAKVPGFAAPFHRALAIGGALDWALVNKPEQVPILQGLWNDYEIRIKKFYSHRFLEMKPGRITVRDGVQEFT